MLRYLLLLFTCSFLVANVAEAAKCGVFKVVKNDVKFNKKGKKKLKKAKINKKVCEGGVVKTGKNGRAKIAIGKDEINVSPDTEMVIQTSDGGKVLLDVKKGRLRANVNKKYQDNKDSYFRVKTKSAVAGVRGTQFLVQMRGFKSRVITFEGKVNVSKGVGAYNPNGVQVQPGFETNVESVGADPEPPKPVPQAELQEIDADTNVDGGAGSTGGAAAGPAPGSKDKDDNKNEDANNNDPANQPDNGEGNANNNDDGGNKGGSAAGGDPLDGPEGPDDDFADNSDAESDPMDPDTANNGERGPASEGGPDGRRVAGGPEAPPAPPDDFGPGGDGVDFDPCANGGCGIEPIVNPDMPDISQIIQDDPRLNNIIQNQNVDVNIVVCVEGVDCKGR